MPKPSDFQSLRAMLTKNEVG